MDTNHDPDDASMAAASGSESANAPPRDLASGLRDERDQLSDQLKRSQADFQNLRRRQAAEIEQAVRRTLAPMFEQTMLALDNLELALAAAPTAPEAQEFARGVALTRDKLLRGLELAGVQRLPPAETFDPLRHEAVATAARDDVPPGTVLEILRAGYAWREQVLRPAQVRVSTAPPPAS